MVRHQQEKRLRGAYPTTTRGCRRVDGKPKIFWQNYSASPKTSSPRTGPTVGCFGRSGPGYRVRCVPSPVRPGATPFALSNTSTATSRSTWPAGPSVGTYLLVRAASHLFVSLRGHGARLSALVDALVLRTFGSTSALSNSPASFLRTKGPGSACEPSSPSEREPHSPLNPIEILP